MITDMLILTEHLPVVTFGRGYRDELPSLPVPVFQIERGGEGTCHCPGQLVAYPIMNISENRVGIRTLVTKMLQAAVHALSRQGIAGEARFDPVGVWVGERKIASLGLAVKRWVTFHGIAVNVNNQLDIFSYINPCGMSATTMTSARKLAGRNVDAEEMKSDFVSSFMESFSFIPERVHPESLPLQGAAHGWAGHGGEGDIRAGEKT